MKLFFIFLSALLFSIQAQNKDLQPHHKMGGLSNTQPFDIILENGIMHFLPKFTMEVYILSVSTIEAGKETTVWEIKIPGGYPVSEPFAYGTKNFPYTKTIRIIPAKKLKKGKKYTIYIDPYSAYLDSYKQDFLAR